MAMREPPHMCCRPRKHTRLSFLTALLLNLTILSVAFLCMPLEAGEFVSNGSFTTGLDGWAASGQIPACGERSWDPEGFIRVSADCSTASGMVGWRQVIPIEGGSHLFLSFRAMSENLDGKGDLVLSFYDSDGEIAWSSGAHAITASTEWRDYHWSLIAPDHAVSLDLFVGATLIVRGSMAFDDLSLIREEEGGYRRILIDCEASAGEIRDLRQTVRSPYADGQDFSRQFETTSIHFVRLHDEASFLDMRELFPDPAADPDDPSAYDFSRADQRIEQMKDLGLDVLFRLGESWTGISSARMSAEKWAEVVTHVVRHYNESWDEGFRYDIGWWEIWNEPNGGHFWSGSDEEFYDLFARASIALKNLDPELKVGGPALAGFESLSWMEGFLSYLAAHNAPLDFFSWHTYHMGNPLHLADAQRSIRSILDAEGFSGTLAFPDEWNLSLAKNCGDNNCMFATLSAYATAHTISALSYLQDTEAPFCFRYRTDGYEVFGLFGDGVTQPLYSPSGLAFLLLADLDTTPIRLPATGTDDAGFTVLAGRQAEGSGEILILVSDPGSADTAYRLSLENPPPAFHWRIREVADPIPCTISDCGPSVIASGDERDFEGGALVIPMRAPAVQEIRIIPDTVGPGGPREPDGRAAGR